MGILSILDSKWTWIGIVVAVAVAMGGILIHEYNSALTAAQAGKDALFMQKQQTIAANETNKELANAYNKLQARSRAQIALVEKQRAQEQIRNAELDTALRHIIAGGHGIAVLNDQLRHQLEHAAGRKFSNQERKSAAGQTGHAVVSLTPYDVKALIHDLTACANYVEASRSGAK